MPPRLSRGSKKDPRDARFPFLCQARFEHALSRSSPRALMSALRPETFYRMNAGLMDAQTGAAVHGAAFGLLRAAKTKRLKEDSTATMSPEIDSGAILALGPASSEYRICPAGSAEEEAALENFQHVWDCAAVACSGASGAPALKWPATREEVPPFADKIYDFARAARSRKTADGYAIGLKGGHGSSVYSVQHFTRMILLSVDAECIPGAVQGLRMRDIQKWHPDRNQHADALLTWSTDAVAALGVNPLMIGCWTCLMNDVPEEGLRRLLTRPWADLWEPVQKYRAERVPENEDSYAPGPRIIEQQLREKA